MLDETLKVLFPQSRDYRAIAEKVLTEVLQRRRFPASEWKLFCERNSVNPKDWEYIVHRLKECGIIKKEIEGKRKDRSFYIGSSLSDYLSVRLDIEWETFLREKALPQTQSVSISTGPGPITEQFGLDTPTYGRPGVISEGLPIRNIATTKSLRRIQDRRTSKLGSGLSRVSSSLKPQGGREIASERLPIEANLVP